MALKEFLSPLKSDVLGHADQFQILSVKPVNGALGAEVSGVDLSKTLDQSTVSEIETALLQNLVLVFRDQDLSAQQLANIGSQFGELHINPFVESVDNVDEVIAVRSKENEEKRFAGLWHSDISWGETPSMGSLLYAKTLPDYGGDTLFANTYLAYETLSNGYKTLLGKLKAVHQVDQYNISTVKGENQPKPVLHPVIRTHPQSGRKALFVNEYFTSRFENMTEKESQPMLSYLFEHSVRPDFTCRISWQPGTLVFWDNRCTQHYATNDYAGQERIMYRVTLNGDVPY